MKDIKCIFFIFCFFCLNTSLFSNDLEKLYKIRNQELQGVNEVISLYSGCSNCIKGQLKYAIFLYKNSNTYVCELYYYKDEKIIKKKYKRRYSDNINFLFTYITENKEVIKTYDNLNFFTSKEEIVITDSINHISYVEINNFIPNHGRSIDLDIHLYDFTLEIETAIVNNIGTIIERKPHLGAILLLFNQITSSEIEGGILTKL